MTKPPTKAERAHMAKVVERGCVVCGMPAECHHVTSDGFQRIGKSHRRVVGLCAEHHRGSRGYHGLGSIQAFVDEYGIDLRIEAEKLANGI